MMIDQRLALTFLELVLFLGILGFVADVWLRSGFVHLYPAFGLVVFGALAVPITYLSGRYSTSVLIVVCVIILGLGIVGVAKKGLPFRFREFRRLTSIIFLLLAVSMIVLGLAQASKYGIPGGVDSAMHSSVINGSLIQSENIQGSYPLGLHISILFLERIFLTNQANIFLSFHLLLCLLTIASLTTFVHRFCHSQFAAYAAFAVCCVDVSLYNNLLNGSGTHLVGPLLIAQLLLVGLLLHERSRVVQWVSLTLVFTALWYFHYPSMFFAVIMLWALRATSRTLHSWVYGIAMISAFILTLPMQHYLFSDNFYRQAIIPGSIAIILGELLFVAGSQWISALTKSRWFLAAIGGISTWLFFYYADSFLFLPTWYGVVLVRLALVGILVTILNPQKFHRTALLAFFGMTSFFALLNLSPFPGQTKVMIELVYYYGFTCSLILLGAVGVIQFFSIVRQRKMKLILAGFAGIYVILLGVSRGLDHTFINAVFADDQPISRYGSSRGFAILSTKNDVDLMTWVKDNLPRDGAIMNPGGLYNAWAALTERHVVRAPYGTPTITDAEPVIGATKGLLQGQPDVDMQMILDHGVKYLLLPEKYAVAIFNPQAVLLHRIGNARLYQLTSAENSSFWLTVPMSTSFPKTDISMVTTGSLPCRFCGDTFYLSDVESLREIVLDPGGTVTLNIKPQAKNTRLSLLVDREPSEIEVQIDNNAWQKVSTENASSVPLQEGISMVIHLRNPSATAQMGIRAIALREEP